MELKYLVDTHILLWAFSDPDRISAEIKSVLDDDMSDVYYSPISLWEIAIKFGLGKLDISGISPEEFLEELESSFFLHKTLDRSTVISSYKLPRYHKDPFDRMLIWDAISSDMVFLSSDARSDAYIENGLKVIH